MTNLEAKLKAAITKDGSVTIAAFMDMAIAYYYATRDPFGMKGDFTTAPEISQMFGELIGAWIADRWQRLGKPKKFLLIEAGPGRGTLMEDALRATKAIEGFHKALSLVLMETSPVLKDRQMAKLAQYSPAWIGDLSHPIIKSSKYPVIFIANEFLDALPMHQFEWRSDSWSERVVTLGDKGGFKLDHKKVTKTSLPLALSKGQRDGHKGIFEISPIREKFVAAIARLVKARNGAALFIDYGYDRPATGDTLQALKKHKFVPVLENVGESDLTSHVDFSVFGHPIMTQAAFLEKLGIRARADTLLKKATPEQTRDIESAVKRLTAADQMGKLFKAMVIQNVPD